MGLTADVGAWGAGGGAELGVAPGWVAARALGPGLLTTVLGVLKSRVKSTVRKSHCSLARVAAPRRNRHGMTLGQQNENINK